MYIFENVQTDLSSVKVHLSKHVKHITIKGGQIEEILLGFLRNVCRFRRVLSETGKV